MLKKVMKIFNPILFSLLVILSVQTLSRFEGEVIACMIFGCVTIVMEVDVFSGSCLE